MIHVFSREFMQGAERPLRPSLLSVYLGLPRKQMKCLFDRHLVSTDTNLAGNGVSLTFSAGSKKGFQRRGEPHTLSSIHVGLIATLTPGIV